MHIFVIAIIIAIGAYVIWLHSQKQPSPTQQNQAPPLVTGAQKPLGTTVFISDGRLYVQNEAGAIHQVESQYVQNMKARIERETKLAGWKQGTTWDTSFAQMRGMGERDEEGEIRFSSVSRIDNTTLLYFLQSFHFGGLFKYDIQHDRETRILHRQNLSYQDLSAPNEKGLILFASFQAGNNSHIATMDTDGENYRELTDGDTIDCAPAWVKNQPEQVVYQSQGLARDPAGYIKGVGPASINLLDMARGDVKAVFSDERFDYLKPQVNLQGDLFFIKRPYEAPQNHSGNILLDTLLFPFRLLRALFHYLNFFSMMYSKKPLTSAGGPQINEDAKTLIIRGKRIETEKALKQMQAIQGAPSLVPSSWQLIRCNDRGEQVILATHVASYCLNQRDEIIYSNGSGVFYLDAQQQPVKLVQENLIEEVYH